ncbi:MAG: hypothetical protein EPN84_01285 [Legionella sp.]|nr:MAG: hypothetical protein EPN84_01285 [Legionella sp.]
MPDHILDTTPEALAAAFNEKKEQLGIGEVSTFHTDAFDNMVKNRITSFSGFFTSKDLTPAQSELKAKLGADSSEAKIVRDAIQVALTPTHAPLSDEDATTALTPFKKAQQDYAESITAFKKLLQQSSAKYSSTVLIGTMSSYKNDAITAIKDQQAAEKTFLQNALGSSEVVKALEATVGKDKVKAAQEAILADLDNGHQKQLDFFNEETSKSIKILQKAAQAKADEFALVAHLAKKLSSSNATRKKIEELAIKNKEDFSDNKGKTTISTKANGDFNLRGISLAALGNINTATGQTLVSNADGSYTINFSRHITSPLYYGDLSTRSNATADMILLATALRKGNHKTITMEVNFSDKELAEKRALQAYEACIKAGFPADKITIMVNNKEYGAKVKNEQGIETNNISTELFKNHQSLYQTLKQEEKQVQKTIAAEKEAVQKHIETSVASRDDIQKVRDEVQKIRTTAKDKPDVDPDDAPGFKPS